MLVMVVVAVPWMCCLGGPLRQGSFAVLQLAHKEPAWPQRAVGAHDEVLQVALGPWGELPLLGGVGQVVAGPCQGPALSRESQVRYLRDLCRAQDPVTRNGFLQRCEIPLYSLAWPEFVRRWRGRQAAVFLPCFR